MPLNMSKWKEIAELVGLVAILLGIYFVYTEIQQNSQIARAELASETSQYIQEIYVRLSDPQFATLYVKGQHSPADLTESERLQLTAFFEQIAAIISRENILFNLNVFGERDSIPKLLGPRFFGSGYGALWWNARKDSFGMRDKIDEALGSAGGHVTLHELDRRITQQIDNL